jgi:hypothetical protein
MTTRVPKWFEQDAYSMTDPIPVQFTGWAGPKGVALVRVWKDGRTDPGWGSEFMHRYHKGQFKMGPILWGYDRKRWTFAFVMRSMRVVCLDIDGKNGGLDHVGQLGMLPLTLAETSKSGEGYHLFYSVSEDEWDELKGFAAYSDRIGLVQGVDLRATGCVYHYPQQRWNTRQIAELPQHMKDRLREHAQRTTAQVEQIVKLLNDPDMVEEALLMQDQLIADLAKPIPAGRRNNTLFAIGSKMMLAQVPNWEDKVAARATAVGLDSTEVTKLLANITKYGTA